MSSYFPPSGNWWKCVDEVPLPEIRIKSKLPFVDWFPIGIHGERYINYSKIPSQRGIYMIGIRIDETIIPIYAGKALNLYERCRREIKHDKNGAYKVCEDIKRLGFKCYTPIHIYYTYALTSSIDEKEKVLLYLYNFAGNIQHNPSYCGDSRKFIEFVRGHQLAHLTLELAKQRSMKQ